VISSAVQRLAAELEMSRGHFFAADKVGNCNHFTASSLRFTWVTADRCSGGCLQSSPTDLPFANMAFFFSEGEAK